MPLSLSSPTSANSAPPPGVVSAKRARVSNRKRVHARELEQQLTLLRDLYSSHYRVPELGEILDKAITSTHRLGESTRKEDRERVLLILHTWDVIEIDELEEESELSRWCLDQILAELKTNRIVDFTIGKPATPAGGRPQHLYSLTGFGRAYVDNHFPPQVKI